MRETSSSLQNPGRPIHLRTTQGRLHVGHPIVVTEVIILSEQRASRLMAREVRTRRTMVAKATSQSIEFPALRRNHSTLARRDGFPRVKTEAG